MNRIAASGGCQAPSLRSRRWEYALAALFGTLVLAGSANADYSFTAVYGANPNATFLLGINNLRQIAGYYVDDVSHHNHGFMFGSSGLYNTYLFTPIDVPDSTDTEAAAINDDGYVAGQYFADSRIYGFVLAADGELTVIEYPSSQDTVANGINRAGQVVGTSVAGGFLLSEGEYTRIFIDGAVNTTASGINEAGEIVGSVRFSFAVQNGYLRDSNGDAQLLDVPDSDSTFAYGINNVGQAVGTYQLGNYHGFVFSDGAFTTIDVPNAQATHATGINDDGVIVGYFYDQDGVHGFIAEPL